MLPKIRGYGARSTLAIQLCARSYSDRKRTASFLEASLSTNCVLLVRQLVNELRSSYAQTSCKECASLRQAARSALRSAGRRGSTRQERLESMLDSNRHHLPLAASSLLSFSLL